MHACMYVLGSKVVKGICIPRHRRLQPPVTLATQLRAQCVGQKRIILCRILLSASKCVPGDSCHRASSVRVFSYGSCELGDLLAFHRSIGSSRLPSHVEGFWSKAPNHVPPVQSFAAGPSRKWMGRKQTVGRRWNRRSLLGTRHVPPSAATTLSRSLCRPCLSRYSTYNDVYGKQPDGPDGQCTACLSAAPGLPGLWNDGGIGSNVGAKP